MIVRIKKLVDRCNAEKLVLAKDIGRIGNDLIEAMKRNDINALLDLNKSFATTKTRYECNVEFIYELNGLLKN